MPRFRCRARNFIITFPQVAENVQPRFDNGTTFLERVTADFGNPLCCRLGRERHADGGVHYHVYLGFDKIVSINSATAFDYFGAHVMGLIQISGLISSAATLKNHFCQRYVSRLQEIGCYPISASSNTPIFITPRRSRNTRPRLSLWRENAILRSPSGRIRQPLGTVDPRGKLFRKRRSAATPAVLIFALGGGASC